MKQKNQIYYSDSSQNSRSEDQVLFQEEANLQPFDQYIPKRKKMKGSYQMRNNLIQIQRYCNQVMQELLKIQMQKTAKQIYEVLTQNWQTSQNSFVFAINFKRNQQDDLQKFIEIMQQEFVYLHQKGFKNKIRKGKQKQKPQIDIVRLQKRSQVKDIALQLHIKGDYYVNTSDKTHLFTVCKISNLSQKNLYCLEKNILPKQFCLVIPTFQNMKLNDGHGFNHQTQKYFYQVYSNKELFIQFVFQCLISNNIKAYLPQEIINLITDFDYYPISYRQGCRRFIYALQKFEKICQDNKMPKTQFVDLSDLIRLLNDTWAKVIGGVMGNFDFLQACKLINKQKFIKTVLLDKYTYTINQKMIQNALNLTKIFQQMDQKDLYERFQDKIKSKIENSQSLKKHAKLLQTKEQKQIIKQGFKKRKPKSRTQMLGYQKKANYRTPKEIFQDKITSLIQQVSQNIRKQARRVKWGQIQFQQRVKPELVQSVAESVFEDREFQEAFDLISSYSSIPLSKLIKMYETQEGGYGRIIYILRSLQIMGLIEINKSNIRPQIVTGFFQKSQFQLK